MRETTFDRRAVLKTFGAGVVGGTTLVGTTSAGETGDQRKQESFVWESNELWEMLESEPPHQHPQDMSKQQMVFEEISDSEGSEAAHEPIWLVGSQADSGLDGADHSPHFGNPKIYGADHVMDFGRFNPQWHVHFVVDPMKPFIEVDIPNGDTEKLPNVVAEVDGKRLTSDDRIESAVNDGDVLVLETDTVFTCPTRPHQHK